MSAAEAEAPAVCANCATPLQGPYCHACGQKGRPARSMRLLAEEVAGSLAHLDNRLLRTLPLLLFRPGKLSREWAHGRHAAYVSPLAVFLFSVFLLFTSLSATGQHLVGPEVLQSSAKVAENFGSKVDVTGKADLYTLKVEETASRLAPLSLVLTVAFLALLLVFKKGINLYDHAVVALYLLSVVTLSITLFVLLQGEPKPLRRIAVGVLFVHTLFHLKGAYRLSWLGAGVRSLALAVLMLGGLIAFMLMVTVVGVMS